MSSASIFRRSTNQPAIPYRRACAKQEDILLMRDTTIWRTTGSHGRSLCPGFAVRIRIRRSERFGALVRLLHANPAPLPTAPAFARTECPGPHGGTTRRRFDTQAHPARPYGSAPQGPGHQQSRDWWTAGTQRDDDSKNSPPTWLATRSGSHSSSLAQSRSTSQAHHDFR